MTKTQETIKKYINRYRKIYKTLKPTYCPALKAQINFTSEGFNHLIFKNGHRRSNKQIKNRLPLISLIIPTLKKCKSSSKVQVMDETYKSRLITVMYFELAHIVGKKRPVKIKIIIKKRGSLGNLFFLSAMKQKTPKKRR